MGWGGGWGWGDPNAHLRATGADLIAHADRLGWSLYPEERSGLERAAASEVYLPEPLSEISIIEFGAAVEKLVRRAEGRKGPQPAREPETRDERRETREERQARRKREREKGDRRDRRFR
jgi:hypothetical protein